MTHADDSPHYAPVSERFVKTARWMLAVAHERRWLDAADTITPDARRHVFKQGAEWLTNFSGLALRERTRLVGVNLALSDVGSFPPPVPPAPIDDYAVPPALAAAFARAVEGALPGWDTTPAPTPPQSATTPPLFADDFLERAAFLLDSLRDIASADAETVVERLNNDPEAAREWAWNEDGGYSEAQAARRHQRLDVQHLVLLAIDRLDLLATIIQSERDRVLLQQ